MPLAEQYRFLCDMTGQFTTDDPTLPCTILIVSADLSEAEFSFMGSKSNGPTEEIWMLIGDKSSAEPTDLAVLLGLFQLDRAFKVVYPGFLPPRPAGAFLFKDGTLRHGRGRTIAPWAMKEVRRLAAVLVEEHSDYLERLVEAIRGRPANILSPLPKDFVLSDEHGHAGVAPPMPPVAVDLCEAPTDVSQDAVIQADYPRDRYMGHLTVEQLSQRIVDVFANLYEVDELGRVSANNSDLRTALWRRLFGELIKEVELRYGPYPAGWKKGDGLLDGAEWPGSLTALRDQGGPVPGRLKPRRLVSGPVLVKYGSARHLAPLLAHGQMLISPASSYDDESLDPARRDDELSFAIDVGSFGIGRLGGLPHSLVQRSGIRKRVVVRSRTDYYVSCFSRALSRRLLLDFSADCCAVIHDPDEFLRRLEAAVAERLPGWSLMKGDVEYFDPLQVTEIEVKPFVWKHFRYAYQAELRVGWFPKSVRAALAPIEVQLEPLSDIAELVELS